MMQKPWEPARQATGETCLQSDRSGMRVRASQALLDR